MKSEKQQSEKEVLELDSFIKKVSIQLYLASKKLENIAGDNQKTAIEISKELNKIDKDILKHFNVKLSNSTKESALEIIKIMK